MISIKGAILSMAAALTVAALALSSRVSWGMVLSPGKLTSPVFTTCSYQNRKCIRIASQKAYVGSLGSLLVMLNANYEIEDSAARKHTVGKAEKVTVDFDLNRVVLTNIDKKGDVVEKVVSLSNFQSTKYFTRP